MSDEDERVCSLARSRTSCSGYSSPPQHDYYAHLTTVSQAVFALVAAALCRLILFGASLHLNLGQL